MGCLILLDSFIYIECKNETDSIFYTKAKSYNHNPVETLVVLLNSTLLLFASIWKVLYLTIHFGMFKTLKVIGFVLNLN